jgi:hypothetical protein
MMTRSSRREQDEQVREAVSALPATFVDGWFTTTWRDHIRVVLSERMYDKDQWRFAFVMEWEDAEKLALHIQGDFHFNKADNIL